MDIECSAPVLAILTAVQAKAFAHSLPVRSEGDWWRLPPAFHLHSPGKALGTGCVIGTPDLTLETVSPLRIRYEPTNGWAAHETTTQRDLRCERHLEQVVADIGARVVGPIYEGLERQAHIIVEVHLGSHTRGEPMQHAAILPIVGCLVQHYRADGEMLSCLKDDVVSHAKAIRIGSIRPDECSTAHRIRLESGGKGLG